MMLRVAVAGQRTAFNCSLQVFALLSCETMQMTICMRWMNNEFAFEAPLVLITCPRYLFATGIHMYPCTVSQDGTMGQ